MNKRIVSLIVLLALPISFFALTISSLPYGIVVFFPDDTVMKKIKDAGIAWIQMGFDWTYIEPQEGKYNFTEADRIIDFADKNGLSILAKIAYTPGWANKNKGKNYPADNVNEWKLYVRTIVNRYRNRVKYWSIWNEPNVPEFFALGKDKYVQRVLVPAAQTIRSVDPAAFIVGPELSHLTNPGSEWYFWMKYILDNAGQYFDIISHHLYEELGAYYLYELLEEGDTFIPAVKTIVEESGQGAKPFWITETGWDTQKYSETMQANRYLDLLHVRARKNFPQKVFFYEIIDGTDPDLPRWGILRSNRESKPAYNTYRNYIAGLLPDPGNPDEGKVNKKCFVEQNAGNGAPVAANPALQRMSQARDFLRGYSASAGRSLDMYYSWNREFQGIALADSRVFNLGRKILAETLDLLRDGNWAAMNRPLPEGLVRDVKTLAGIILSSYPDSSIAAAAQMINQGLDPSSSRSPHDLLEFHLEKNIRKFKKIR